MLKKTIIIGIVIIFISIISFQYRKLSIISGYAAKEFCSCVYLANRNADSVRNNDLFLPFIKYAKTSLNTSEQSATAKVFGISSTTAFYQDGFGCILSDRKPIIKGFPKYEWKNTEADSMYWPYGFSKAHTPSHVSNSITQVADSFFKTQNRTRSLIIIRNDSLLFERYASDITDSTRLLGWSMTKSIFNGIVGIMVKQGKISLNRPVNIKEWANDERKEISLFNLLHMSSGLKWEEDYKSISDATKMLYQETNMYQYAIAAKQTEKPGTTWLYSSGTSNIISGIIRQTLNNDSVYYSFPYKEIFDKINARSFLIETDASGNFVASSYSWATTRDWAKLGLLYMHRGKWNGLQILPKNWIELSKAPAKGSNYTYGAHIWLYNANDKEDILSGMIMFKGHNGQRVFILPEKNIVVVRMGLKNMDEQDFYRYIRSIVATN